MREEGILKLHFTKPFFIFHLETSISKLKGTPNSVRPTNVPDCVEHPMYYNDILGECVYWQNGNGYSIQSETIIGREGLKGSINFEIRVPNWKKNAT